VLIIVEGANVKNADICAANDLLSDELLVDPKTKGVANVFVSIAAARRRSCFPAVALSSRAIASALLMASMYA
jgi:hypothetical protein